MSRKLDNATWEEYILNEVKITIGNAIITIPVSEAILISSIVKELAAKC